MKSSSPSEISVYGQEKVADTVRLCKGDKRLPLGTPSTDNANYLWIQHFWSALNEKGRAGFVMANSASDARGTEAEIRKQLIESNAVDIMVSPPLRSLVPGQKQSQHRQKRSLESSGATAKKKEVNLMRMSRVCVRLQLLMRSESRDIL
ncbi:Type I restriction-modification system specificity subunit [Methanosarcina mazei Tuc01]|uniref:Type I restriction-modification system specificity subunit n=1 Tax=Methanosarcina mazei Tuc01 TaxID=1236903 RepID=M1QM29_METMZ|nr:N-6 DNA methylase [Methanosarcina mazei]AGF98084.1 Type I restriction-modification system specificity subunit [Methanosarcina mazei Tuc01]